MNRNSAVLRLPALFLCALAIAACQKNLWLNPPSTEHVTALVLPLQLEKRAQYGDHGFDYFYRIENLDGIVEPIDVRFRLPIKGDMVIVNHLPPGNYRVSQFRFGPRGSGNFTYGNNLQRRNDRFRLERNRITILNRSLNVLVYNETPGRGMSNTYAFDVEPLEDAHREQVIETLRQLEHFDSWTILDGDNLEARHELRDDKSNAEQDKIVSLQSVGGRLEGYYQSEITSDHYAVFRHPGHRQLKIRFSQDGDRIIGRIDDSDQQIEGQRIGDTIRFRFALPGFGYDIEGQWEIPRDTDRIEGSWYFAAYDARGQWNLQRLDP